MSDEERARIFTPAGIHLCIADRFRPDVLSSFTSVSDEDLARASAAMEAGVSPECDRSIGCLLGLLVGDALGAPLEFHAVRYPDPNGGWEGGWSETPDAGFNAALWANKGEDRATNRFGLEMGQWTDDGSMALCLADSLLRHGGLHPQDLRQRFLLWWRLGLNNAFGHDPERRERMPWTGGASIGLGGTVSESLAEFMHAPSDYTSCGSVKSSGNGSIMRLAPIPILYRRDPVGVLDAAWRQSKVTHQGDEAADCARLLAWLCARAIRTGESKDALLDALVAFPATLYSTSCLASSAKEEPHADNSGLDLSDRDWRWRAPAYRYSASRTRDDPGYVGSYAMDAMAMALHIVHVSPSFEGALLMAANTCGDADTLAAITGQLAGACFGAKAIPTAWAVAVERWDPLRTVRARAWLLHDAPRPLPPSALERPSYPSWKALEVAEAEEARVATMDPRERYVPMTLGLPSNADAEEEERARRRQRAERFRAVADLV